MPQAEPGCRQSRVSEKQDGSDWQKKSPCGGNVEETRKPGLFPFCCSAKMWASCLGQQSQSRKEAQVILASHQSLCSQRSSSLQAALTHRRQSSSLLWRSPGAPGTSSWGLHGQFLSIQLIMKFPVSVEGQQLWVQGERKLTEGVAGPAKWPTTSRRRSLPPGWQLALPWGITQHPAK